MGDLRNSGESGAQFVESWLEQADRLAEEGLYDPAYEHDACGVGLIAAIDGKPRRSVSKQELVH